MLFSTRPSQAQVAQHLVWVLVKGVRISYHNKETILCTIDPDYCNLNKLLNKTSVVCTTLKKAYCSSSAACC